MSADPGRVSEGSSRWTDVPLEGVLARDADRLFEGADDTVTDPVASVAAHKCVGPRASEVRPSERELARRDGRSLEAGERTLEAFDVEHLRSRDRHFVHEDRSGCVARFRHQLLSAPLSALVWTARTDRGPEGGLVLDRRSRQALHALQMRRFPPSILGPRSTGTSGMHLVEDKPADLAVPLALGPDDKDVGDRGVGDPGLGAREEVPASAGGLARLGRHAGRICEVGAIRG